MLRQYNFSKHFSNAKTKRWGRNVSYIPTLTVIVVYGQRFLSVAFSKLEVRESDVSPNEKHSVDIKNVNTFFLFYSY